jgi:hypothetical protein
MLGEEPEVEVALVAREATRQVALWAYREGPGGLWGGWGERMTRVGSLRRGPVYLAPYTTREMRRLSEIDDFFLAYSG